jgi:Recombinase
LARARRGELALPLPVGLVYDPAGKVVLDPDAQVQGAIGHLFMTFARTGSARATVTAFAKEGLSFPRRLHRGPHRGELAWGRLEHSQVLNVLHNPRYAGAFCYGRNRYRRGVDGRSTANCCPATSGPRSSPAPTRATSASRTGSEPRPSWPPTPRRTGRSGGRARLGRAPRCSKGWWCAGAAGGA